MILTYILTKCKIVSAQLHIMCVGWLLIYTVVISDHHNSLWLYTGIVLMLSLATFSKEQGITIAGVCVLYDIFIVQQVSSYWYMCPRLEQAG